MIEPGSFGDWVQASLMMGLLGGAALLWWQRKAFSRPMLWLTASGLLIGLVFLFLGMRAD